MGYNEELADRIRDVLRRRRDVRELQMFGGLAFLLDGNMLCGVVNDDLVVRVGEARYEEALSRPHARPMDFTGRPMKTMVFVGPNGVRTERVLKQWIDMGLEFVSSLPSKTSRKGPRR